MAEVLKHISFARDWLDKAEKKVKKDSAVEGELFLSLAEAEIHKAWEKSISVRRKSTPSLLEKINKFNPGKLAFIVGLVLIISFIGFNYDNSLSDKPNLELSLKHNQEYSREKSFEEDLVLTEKSLTLKEKQENIKSIGH